MAPFWRSDPAAFPTQMLSIKKKKSFGPALSAALLFFASASASMADAAEPWAFSAQYGEFDDHRRATLGAESAALWSHAFGSGRSRVDLTAEYGVSYWRTKQRRPDDGVWQVNAVPMFRWWPAERFFAEGGIGATVFSHTRFAGRELSTAFQFGDHLGLGYQLTPSIRLGMRISHFSNGSIKLPNSGLNLVQLTLVQRF